ncbi:MAG: Gfo/Idh/MocA family oxidoreductase, partial [bacterium]
VGVHCLDSLRFVLDDEVTQVQSLLDPKPTSEKTESTAQMLLQFSQGTMASIFCSYESPVRESYLDILGTEARMTVADFTVGGRRASLKIDRRAGNDLPDSTIEEIDVPNLYVEEVTLFSECILNDVHPPLTALNALHNQRVLDAAMSS